MVVYELREDAADRPHFDSISVLALQQDNFWSSVPTCDHMESEFLFFLFLLLIMFTLLFKALKDKIIDLLWFFVGCYAAGKPEVTNFDFVKILTDQNVFRFEVAVQNLG